MQFIVDGKAWHPSDEWREIYRLDHRLFGGINERGWRWIFRGGGE